MQRPENHVQRNPVSRPAHQQAEEGQHPPDRVDIPDRHLDKAKKEAEVEARVDDEAEFHFAALDKDPVQQLLVAGQAVNDHTLDVQQVFDVVGDVFHQVVHQLRGGFADAIVDHLAS